MRYKNLIIGLFILSNALIARAQGFFEVEPMEDLNTPEFSELNAWPFNDGLLFCANRSNYFLTAQLTPDETPLFDIYYVKKQGDKWGEPVLFSEELNSRFHEGPISIDKKKNRIYFTRNSSRSLKDDNPLGIFIADITTTGVSNIRPFNHNNPGYNVAYPAIHQETGTLYFCMDKRGGEGGYDIYQCKAQGDTFAEPVNLGPVINTRGNEVYPFVHTSGRLYYSSNRLPNSIGRHDIYYSDEILGQWATPKNPGDPVNSKRDDFSFYINEDYTTGYLTSDRNRSVDLFEISSIFPDFQACNEVQENNYCFVFYEEGSMNLESTAMSYEWDLGDGKKIRGLEASHCYKGPGFYIIQLNVIDTLTGEVYFNEATYEFPLEKIEQPYITSKDTAYVGDTVRFDALESHIKEFTVGNFYWDFDDGDKAGNEIVYHVFRKPGTYRVKLGAVNKQSRKEEQKKACSYKDIVILKPALSIKSQGL